MTVHAGRVMGVFYDDEAATWTLRLRTVDGREWLATLDVSVEAVALDVLAMPGEHPAHVAALAAAPAVAEPTTGRTERHLLPGAWRPPGHGEPLPHQL